MQKLIFFEFLNTSVVVLWQKTKKKAIMKTSKLNFHQSIQDNQFERHNNLNVSFFIKII
jgi:hypothetical protein